MSKSSFAELGVSRTVVDALARGGITEPFPVQRLVIGEVLAGHDVLVRSPTGSGKTLAFALPLVERIAADAARPAALILAPTRELVVQIAEELYPIAHARALKTAPVYGGVGLTKQSQLAARAHILVATPGRLEDLIARGAFDLDAIQAARPRRGRPDARHGLSPRRRPDRARAAPAARQTLFFSATLSGETGRVAKAYTRDAVRHRARPRPGRSQRPSVEHRFVEVETRVARSGTGRRARHRARPDARLRAHQARRRPPRQAPWRPRRAAPSRCTATARRASASARSPASSRRRSARWSRPTSPRAASTWTASRT